MGAWIETCLSRRDTAGRARPGYKPHKISTIVDPLEKLVINCGYKPHKISTIVDNLGVLGIFVGYKPHKISTIVDFIDYHHIRIWAISPIKFLLL